MVLRLFTKERVNRTTRMGRGHVTLLIIAWQALLEKRNPINQDTDFSLAAHLQGKP